MKKALLIVLGLAGLLALLPTAQAITYPFEGGMAGLTADPVYTTGPYQRYYTPGDDDVNRNCTVTCGTGGASCDQTDPAMKYCKLTYNSTKKAFRGYGENVANYNAALEDGTVFYSILDAQKVDGGRTVGLYAWVAGPVWNNSKNTWSAADCVGTTVAQACIGNANPSNARAVTGNPPGGALNVVGGLSPIPAPLAFDIDHDGNAYTVGGVKGTFQLQWDAAFAVGPAATGLVPVGYDLYFAKSAPSGGSCASPTPAQYTFLETIPGVQAQIPYTAVGMADPNEAACVTFALKVVFPSTLDGKKMVTRYLSSNGTTFALAVWLPMCTTWRPTSSARPTLK